jgi:ABC-type Fe3+-siderophore transport system, permease component
MLFILLASVVLAATAVGMLTAGTAKVPVDAVVAVLLGHFLGIANQDIPTAQQIIVWNIRWQRVALAMLVGSGLAVAGACFQTMFKNPLADPFVLGVSSGAALGAALAIITGRSELMITLAFAGALLSLALVYFFGRRSVCLQSDQHLLLAGVTCGAMLNAMLYALMALHSEQINMIVFWLMGSLTNYVGSLKPVLAIIALGLAVAMIYARDLDVMALGDDEARLLGVDVARVRLIMLVVTTLMTGACVSVSGIIGFIGLIVPHLVRKVAGPGHLILLPLSAILGATFLMLADGLTRFAPLLAGVPVGVVTALFGSPFFLYVLYNVGRRLP